MYVPIVPKLRLVVQLVHYLPVFNLVSESKTVNSIIIVDLLCYLGMISILESNLHRRADYE